MVKDSYAGDNGFGGGITKRVTIWLTAFGWIPRTVQYFKSRCIWEELYLCASWFSNRTTAFSCSAKADCLPRHFERYDC